MGVGSADVPPSRHNQWCMPVIFVVKDRAQIPHVDGLATGTADVEMVDLAERLWVSAVADDIAGVDCWVRRMTDHGHQSSI